MLEDDLKLKFALSYRNGRGTNRDPSSARVWNPIPNSTIRGLIIRLAIVISPPQVLLFSHPLLQGGSQVSWVRFCYVSSSPWTSKK